MSSIFQALVIYLALTAGASSVAAVNHQITDGKLMGATGIQVGTSFFDVAFSVESCNHSVAGCGVGSFVGQPINSATAATAASEALRDQVFSGMFDTDLGKTFGCGAGTVYCQVLTPYAINFKNKRFFNYVGFYNAVSESDDYVTNANPSLDRSANMSFVNNSNSSVILAVWSPSNANPDPINPPSPPPIPEPSTYALILAGLGLVVAAARHRQVNAA